MKVKQLGRLTPANLIKIRTPIWNGGRRAVGIATYKVGSHNEIQIDHINSDGTRLYPEPFYISGEELAKYPAKPVKKHPNIMLHIVPIDDLYKLERI